VFPEFSTSADSALPAGWVPATVDFAGRRWELQFEAPPLFGLSTLERNVWVIVLSAGLGLTLFASVAMFSLLRARLAARSDLDLMTSQIRVIVDSAIESIVVVDRNNRVVWANQSFAEAFNLGEPQSLAGRDWTAVRESPNVELTDREGFLSRLAEVSNSETLTVESEDIRIKAPQERTLSMTSSPVTDATGQYLGRLFVFRDVTMERTADEAKSEFISMVSHELRTPITSMVGYVDLLLDGAGGPLNGESQRLLKIVQRNGSRLSHLVSDILDLSRIDSMRFTLDPQSLDLRKLLEEIAESMARDFRQKRQTVELRMPDEMPDVWADRDRTAQIFTNLISNAHRYTPEGGSVMVEVTPLDQQVTISVSDTGIGIRPEDHARVFDRFVRLHRGGKRPQGSTGLGLAITKALVELHGGSISVESAPGQGSTFTVTLPRAMAEPKVA
jgi:PAS domain S-box-containing protein